MLLAVDVGNTNTVLGLYEADRLVHDFRIETSKGRTTDEYLVTLLSLLQVCGVGRNQVKASILASVVPALNDTWVECVDRAFDHDMLVVGPGIKTGMPILYENPREVGADRVVNAVAAFERTRAATLVVDFGTATTFDAISAKGEYLGGAICPGVSISADALYQRASKLPRVDVVAPARVIGRNTVASMQAGIVFGYVALVDGMVARFDEEYGARMRVLATGGLGGLFAEHCVRIEEFDPDLTLDGLRILFERNQPNPGHV